MLWAQNICKHHSWLLQWAEDYEIQGWGETLQDPLHGQCFSRLTPTLTSSVSGDQMTTESLSSWKGMKSPHFMSPLLILPCSLQGRVQVKKIIFQKKKSLLHLKYILPKNWSYLSLGVTGKWYLSWKLKPHCLWNSVWSNLLSQISTLWDNSPGSLRGSVCEAPSEPSLLPDQMRDGDGVSQKCTQLRVSSRGAWPATERKPETLHRYKNTC